MSTVKLHTVETGIVWAEIDRPEARNAINFQVIDELEQIVQKIKSDDQIRVFILSGTGSKAFVSGGDLKEFHTIQSEEEAKKMSVRMQTLLSKIEQLPCWTIACINGNAYGGGIEILLAFDFHIASKDVVLGFTQGKFYLTPGWGGLTRLIEKTGKSKALQLLGEHTVIDSSEALRLGIIEYVVPSENLKAETAQFARRLSKNDRNFITTLKHTAGKFNPERVAMLEGEIEPFSKLWVHEEHTSRVDQFIKKSKRQ